MKIQTAASSQPPKVSVIVPVYNGAATLVSCLRAIESSDYANYECLVVNDGSTDNTLALAQQFTVRLVQVENGPRGPAHARNRGAEVAQGDILINRGCPSCLLSI